ncbi:MAG: peptidoglycan-binding domain-containing protein, partial [Candidatus Paceibacterota bacterium]
MTAQDTINRKVIAGFVGLAMAVTFAFAGVASVNAQDSSTIAALQAQIAALQAQLAALAGGGTGASAGAGCSVTFTQSLSQGSTGSEVMALQKFLNANGYQVASAGSPGSAGMETSYFGPATRAAVVAFQNGNAAQVLAPVGLSNGTGFWGPSSRGHANAMCAAQATPPTSGGDDDSSSGGSSALQGGAGSLDDADWISNLNNEEVGEGANDVEVAGLEIEADDSSDLEIVA